MMQGITPGPDLMETQSGLVYTFLISFLIANIIMLILGVVGARYIGKILAISVHYLAPAIMFLTIVGSYAIRNNIIDVAFFIFFGFLSYILKQLYITPPHMVVAVIL